MVDITIDIRNVDIKKIGNELHITMEGINGQKVCVITDAVGGELLQEATEKAVVNPTYWYCNMQEENDRLQDRINDLEEVLDNIGYSEVV